MQCIKPYLAGLSVAKYKICSGFFFTFYIWAKFPLRVGGDWVNRDPSAPELEDCLAAWGGGGDITKEALTPTYNTLKQT